MSSLEKLFGLKARRLADTIGQQGRDAYAALDVRVDAKLNSLIIALGEITRSTSTELASQTGLSRQLVETRLAKMEREGLVSSATDDADARRRLYFLTDEAHILAQRVHAVMTNFESVYQLIWDEIGVDLADAISKAEAALNSRSLTDRYLDQFATDMPRKEFVQ